MFKKDYEELVLKQLISFLEEKEGLLGVDTYIQKDSSGWSIFDIEDQELYWSPDIEQAAQVFIDMETADVVEKFIKTRLPLYSGCCGCHST